MTNIGNKEVFARNLQHFITVAGIDRNKLCEDLDFKYSTVSEWLAANKYPRIDKIEILAKYFKVKKSDLIEDHNTLAEPSNIRSYDTENIYMIPVFDSVSAGFGATAVDYITEYAPAFIKNPHDAGDYIYINVEGDSMFPKIEDGDRILVRRQTSVDSGSVAVVLVDGEDALVKKVVYGKTWIELHSFNPMYKTMRFDDEDVQRLQVLGLVKEVIKEL